MTTPLEAALATLPTTGDENSMLVAAKCRGLMIGYDHRWNNAGWETISVEEVFELPVINPETGAKSRTFKQSGKFDGVITRDGRKYLLEHKTTSEDISDPNAVYWRRLAIDSQVSAYVLANWQAGRKLDGTVYDVIKKPGIRPKNLSKAELAQIVATRSYCGYMLSRDVADAIALGQTRECNELYAMRLAAEAIENPDKYFARRVINRLDSEIAEYAQELWDVGQSIISARTNNAHYRNSGACVEYSTPCEFLGICSGYDTPESDRWERADWAHAELPESKGSLDVLTNSRVKCFHSCRRKHFYKYELGLKRKDEEEREALYMGSVLHAALEAWWLCYRKGNDEHGKNAAGGTGPSAATGCQTQLAF